ncbi:Para-aminobenzoate synthase component I [Anopheles sinensis]|uniref:Para-aminobenzoate synthase component I n=1 Tax=Anopheles sinensis TaxID=74873 RepID=A0A084VHU3_ANOSI|nr:Para-aminobenzoate synthase component I [Anopheles sinensis]
MFISNPLRDVARSETQRPVLPEAKAVGKRWVVGLVEKKLGAFKSVVSWFLAGLGMDWYGQQTKKL